MNKTHEELQNAIDHAVAAYNTAKPGLSGMIQEHLRRLYAIQSTWLGHVAAPQIIRLKEKEPWQQIP